MQTTDKLFFQDFIDAIKFTDQWLFLGWHDIKSKYRRTKLGPLWIVMVNLVTIACFSIVGSALFGQKVTEFLPHVAVGLFVWYYISTILLESCTIYSSQSHLLKNLSINQLTLVLRLFVRNTIAFAHSFIIIIVIIGLFVNQITIASIWLSLLALPFFASASVGISILLGTLATRYRDITHMVNAAISIFPFITPLIWKEEMLGNRAYIATINPVTHFIALIRDPLIGNEIKPITYIVSFISCSLLLILGVYVYNKFNKRIVFWL